jgi:hypothetical protein
VSLLIDEPNVRLEITEEGFFHVRVTEANSDEGVEGSARPEVDAILDRIQVHLEERAPVYYLVGFKGMEDLSLAERWRVAGRMRDNRKFITRSAVYGLSTKLQFAFRVIIRVSGRDDLRAFRTEDHARTWLEAGMREDGYTAGA